MTGVDYPSEQWLHCQQLSYADKNMNTKTSETWAVHQSCQLCCNRWDWQEQSDQSQDIKFQAIDTVVKLHKNHKQSWEEVASSVQQHNVYTVKPSNAKTCLRNSNETHLKFSFLQAVWTNWQSM